jgi:hypothetical protein
MCRHAVTLTPAESLVPCRSVCSSDGAAPIATGWSDQLPGETHETLAETEAFIKRVPIDTLRLTYFTPFPNTDITGDLAGNGELVADWTRLNFYNIAYIPTGLTHKDLERAYRRIMAQFYFKPRVLASFLPHLIVPRKALALMRGSFGLGKLLTSTASEPGCNA